MKVAKVKKVKKDVQDEQELLQQEDSYWLAELREAVSPYWASRLAYQAARGPVLAIQGPQTKGI